MVHLRPSIIAALTQPGPSITLLNNDVSTYRPGLGARLVKEITHWDDLSFLAITDAYGDILDQDHAGHPTLAALIHINNIIAIPDVKQMESGFLLNLLEPSLLQGCGIIASRLGQSNQQGPDRIKIRRDCQIGRARPNTAFFWGTELLVPGAAGRDGDWDFFAWDTDLRHPTARLAGYATGANTRYAYTVTDRSIILCQFYQLPGTHGQLGARYKLVPLDASGSGTLTPALALWAVVMMAMDEAHRPIVTLQETGRLNEWVRLLNDMNQAVYRNVLSGREAQLAPDGGVVLDLAGKSDSGQLDWEA